MTAPDTSSLKPRKEVALRDSTNFWASAALAALSSSLSSLLLLGGHLPILVIDEGERMRPEENSEINKMAAWDQVKLPACPRARETKHALLMYVCSGRPPQACTSPDI
jgi:hypothetical protein